MNELWEKVETLYHAARELDRQQQARFLDEACRTDAEIRQKVDDLLSQDRKQTSFLNTTAAEEFADKLLEIDSQAAADDFSGTVAAQVCSFPARTGKCGDRDGRQDQGARRGDGRARRRALLLQRARRR